MTQATEDLPDPTMVLHSEKFRESQALPEISERALVLKTNTTWDQLVIKVLKSLIHPTVLTTDSKWDSNSRPQRA
jgi:hypothetical protein